MKKLERFLKALADKNRLRILKLLERRKMCVCELAFVIGITQPSVSKHLKKLSNAGIVGSHQDHFWTNYFLRKDNAVLSSLLKCLNRSLRSENIIKKDARKLQKANRACLCLRR